MGKTKHPLDTDRIKAVLFDYGNTLIEFSRRQVERCDEALARTLEKHFGPVDRKQLRVIRDRDRLAPYMGDPPEHIENDMRDISRRLVRELFGREAEEQVLEDILQTRHASFVAVVRAAPYVKDMLHDLQARYVLGLLSNYPDGKAIRETLGRNRLLAYFRAVVVSGDVGHVKPHPAPFQVILDDIGLAAGDCLFVGDNWFGDIQGAKRMGMQACFITQWHTLENFAPEPGDMEPDLRIGHILELRDHLL